MQLKWKKQELHTDFIQKPLVLIVVYCIDLEGATF
jgi:hypothetical protein